MKKKIYLSERELVQSIQNILKITEQDNPEEIVLTPEFSVEPDLPTTPREDELKKIFGSYSDMVMDDVFRYIRKNPRLFFQRLWKIYGDKAYKYLDMYSKKGIVGEQTNIESEEEDDDYNFRDELIKELRSKIESEEDFEESDISDIYEYGKPLRRGRGSIYIDFSVPRTDDREFDKEVGVKILEYYSKMIKESNYVGGLGFKTNDRLRPFDDENF